MSDELPLALLLADVARLHAEAGQRGAGHPVLDQALNSLERSIEELQVASEELQVKNEELLLALRELEDERRRYRDLFDLAADGYLVTDAQGAVVEANRAAGELLGRPAESLVGLRLVDLLAPGTRIEAARRLRQASFERGGETILQLASGRDDARLVHARCRRHDDGRGGEPQSHWTLTDLLRPLLESETAAGGDAALSRRWLGIYEELVSVTEALLDSATARAQPLSRTAREHLLESEVRPLEARLAHLRARRDAWTRRHREQVGLEIDIATGEVHYRGRVVEMTRRELQLLGFLFTRPGKFFPASVLLARAWHASYLSEEQVRTYVGRLRRKLAQLDVPCELVTRRQQGYALLFSE
ncbi:MAG TPA: winged helix-turn-helix domain-containing protein [Terriglobales bacterium]|nr:winged helix-turn-helix domain-containing protein [Terriglobales bacterium]